MRTSIYLPSISCATTSTLTKSDADIMKTTDNIKHSLRFYNTKADNYFKHPYILISSALHAAKHTDIRKDLQVSPDTTVFVDSGGYQLATGKLKESKWNNRLALAWSEKNGDLFPILDRPVDGNMQQSKIDECLKLSAEAAKYYHEHRSNSECHILNVLSAGTVPRMEEWYAAVKDYEFDGWAHGGSDYSMKGALKGILFLINKGEFQKESVKWHHVFGLSGLECMIYFAQAQKLLNMMGINVQITFDSSYFQRNLAFGGWFVFPSYHGMKQVTFSNTYDYTKMPRDVSMPCTCPVCSDIENVKSWVENKSDFYMMGLEHNLLLMLNYKHTVDSLVNMNSFEMLKGAYPARIYSNLLAIVDAFKNPKAGYEIIDRRFVGKEVKKVRGSLEGFFGGES